MSDVVDKWVIKMSRLIGFVYFFIRGTFFGVFVFIDERSVYALI